MLCWGWALFCNFLGTLLFIPGLARLNAGEETFLLVTAALANLTFMSPLTALALQRCNTARTLVRAVRAAAGGSTLFARDQVSV